MQSNTAPLALIGDGYTIEITVAAQGLKNTLLRHAAAVIKVDSLDGQAFAHEQLKRLAEFRTTLEKCRTEVKAPVLRVGRSIDDKAAEFSRETDAEEKRIKGLLSGFALKQEQERRRIADEARKVQDEADKKRREAEELQRRAEAEETSLADAAKATQQQKQASAEAAQAETKAAEIIVAAPPPVKMQLDFTVTDIHALYAACPILVSLAPKRREILDYLEVMKSNGVPPVLPGIEVREVPKISTR